MTATRDRISPRALAYRVVVQGQSQGLDYLTVGEHPTRVLVTFRTLGQAENYLFANRCGRDLQAVRLGRDDLGDLQGWHGWT